jgi:hypothetical protein
MSLETNLKHLIEVMSEKYPAKKARQVVALAANTETQACLKVSRISFKNITLVLSDLAQSQTLQ